MDADQAMANQLLSGMLRSPKLMLLRLPKDGSAAIEENHPPSRRSCKSRRHMDTDE
jgi:hypothetical protein